MLRVLSAPRLRFPTDLRLTPRSSLSPSLSPAGDFFPEIFILEAGNLILALTRQNPGCGEPPRGGRQRQAGAGAVLAAALMMRRGCVVGRVTRGAASPPPPGGGFGRRDGAAPPAHRAPGTPPLLEERTPPAPGPGSALPAPPHSALLRLQPPNGHQLALSWRGFGWQEYGEL